VRSLVQSVCVDLDMECSYVNCSTTTLKVNFIQNPRVVLTFEKEGLDYERAG